MEPTVLLVFLPEREKTCSALKQQLSQTDKLTVALLFFIFFFFYWFFMILKRRLAGFVSFKENKADESSASEKIFEWRWMNKTTNLMF